MITAFPLLIKLVTVWSKIIAIFFKVNEHFDLMAKMNYMFTCITRLPCTHLQALRN